MSCTTTRRVNPSENPQSYGDESTFQTPKLGRIEVVKFTLLDNRIWFGYGATPDAQFASHVYRLNKAATDQFRHDISDAIAKSITHAQWRDAGQASTESELVIDRRPHFMLCLQRIYMLDKSGNYLFWESDTAHRVQVRCNSDGTVEISRSRLMTREEYQREEWLTKEGIMQLSPSLSFNAKDDKSFSLYFPKELISNVMNAIVGLIKSNAITIDKSGGLFYPPFAPSR